MIDSVLWNLFVDRLLLYAAGAQMFRITCINTPCMDPIWDCLTMIAQKAPLVWDSHAAPSNENFFVNSHQSPYGNVYSLEHEQTICTLLARWHYSFSVAN